jgi:hypothetical protein
MRINLNGLLFAFLLFSACNSESKTDTTDKDAQATNSTDTNSVVQTTPTANPDPTNFEQGCDKSIGQRYSKVTKTCVLLIDLATLQPKDPKLDASKPTYLVFGTDAVEIFLPTQENSIVIRKTKSNPDIWENGPLKLSRTTTGFRLEDEGKLIYSVGE